MRLAKVIMLVSVLLLPLMLMGCGEETAGDAKFFFKKKATPNKQIDPQKAEPTQIEKVKPELKRCTPKTVLYCDGSVLIKKVVQSNCVATVSKEDCGSRGCVERSAEKAECGLEPVMNDTGADDGVGVLNDTGADDGVGVLNDTEPDGVGTLNDTEPFNETYFPDNESVEGEVPGNFSGNMSNHTA